MLIKKGKKKNKKELIQKVKLFILELENYGGLLLKNVPLFKDIVSGSVYITQYCIDEYVCVLTVNIPEKYVKLDNNYKYHMTFALAAGTKHVYSNNLIEKYII